MYAEFSAVQWITLNDELIECLHALSFQGDNNYNKKLTRAISTDISIIVKELRLTI